MNENRQKIIDEAVTWLRTPWRHEASVKGAGVDCARFLIEVYANCGLIKHFIPASYPQDFALHSAHERFLYTVDKYAQRIHDPLPGDIAIWKFGKCFSHGAIIIDYPVIIHAKIEEGVILDRGDMGKLKNRDVLFYSVF